MYLNRTRRQQPLLMELPCTGELSVANAIGTLVRDLVKRGTCTAMDAVAERGGYGEGSVSKVQSECRE